MTTTATQSKTAPAKRRSLTGIKVGLVTNHKRDKTRTVTVSYQVRHPKYGKYLKRCTRYHVHDSDNTSRSGDMVEIVNCRPISKTKRWRLVRVVKRGETQ